MDELKALMKAANERIAEIVGDIRDLKNRIKDGGLTPDEVAELKAQLTAHVESLAAVASLHDSTPTPAPEPAPEPEPTPEPAPEADVLPPPEAGEANIAEQPE